MKQIDMRIWQGIEDKGYKWATEGIEAKTHDLFDSLFYRVKLARRLMRFLMLRSDIVFGYRWVGQCGNWTIITKNSEAYNHTGK